MKLRNLMYATMIACAFASCSKDEVPAPDGGNGEAAGTVLDIRSDAAGITKAGETDATISSLTLVIFNGNNVEATSTYSSTSTDAKGEGDISVKKTGLTAGVKSIVVLANYRGDAISTSDTKTSVWSKVANFVTGSALEETNGKMTMNSSLYENVNVVADKHNLFGYDAIPSGVTNGNLITGAEVGGVKLYRNVAKIVLNGVYISERLIGDQTQFPDAKLTVKQAFVLNAKGQAKVAGNGNKWGSTQVASDNSGFVWYSGVVPASGETWGADFAYATATANNGLSQAIENIAITKTSTKASPYKFNNVSFYTYENYSANDDVTEDIKTLLVVKGDFSYKGLVDNQETTINNADRYYTVAVGRTGMTDGIDLSSLPEFKNIARDGVTSNKAFDVLRNLQYNITIGINSLGYKTPTGGGSDDTTILDVQCQVVEFGQVDQDVEI